MDKTNLPLNNIKYKTSPRKVSCQEVSLIQKDKFLINNLGEFTKIKEAQVAIKAKNEKAKKIPSEESPTYLQDIKFTPIHKKAPQSPRMNIVQQEKFIETKQLIKYSGFPKQRNYQDLKTHSTGNLFTPQTKKINTQLTNKKQAILSTKQLRSVEKIRINSPSTQEKQSQNKRNYILSPRFSQQLQQINLLSKSTKLLQYQKVQQKLKSLKELKELKQTISTTSSNKSVKPLKINDFDLGKDLGKGKFGNVRIAKHKKTGMLFSIKIINKLMVKQDDIINQLIKQTKIQSFLNHSHIVKLYSVFDDQQNVYLLMELCCQGNLYQYMQIKGKIPEPEASEFMKETCEAVRQLHFYKIIHRDIKPENIVLCFGMLKICDFGWSTQIKGSMRQTFCGSPLYISPQLLKGQLYDEKVDLWALGILGYQMMAGTIPFQIVTQRDLIKILNTRIIYPSTMSSRAVSFLQELLQKNPQNRSSVQQLMSHPFINRSKDSELQ